MAFVGWAWDKLIEREFIQKTQLQYQAMISSEDMYFVFMAIIQADRISYLPQLFAHHRFEDNSSVSHNRDPYFENYLLALEAIRESLIELKLYPSLELEFINYFIHSTLWNLNSLSQASKSQLIKLLKRKYFKLFRLDKLHPEQIFELNDIGKFVEYFPRYSKQLTPNRNNLLKDKLKIQWKNYTDQMKQTNSPEW
jgi:hypothetical protein